MTRPRDATNEAETWLKKGTAELPAKSNNVPGITDWYGLQDKWCAMFVSRVLHNVGMPQTASTSKGFSWTVAGRSWYQRLGAWHSGPEGCREGDLMFYKYGSSSSVVDHVGLVVRDWDGSTFETIEGNWGDRVSHLKRTSAHVVGYGRPSYALPGLNGAAAPKTPTISDPRTAVPGIWRKGDHNLGVAILQVRLNNLRDVIMLAGQPAWGPSDVSADFDDATLLNVAAFQTRNELEPDGKFGPISARKMAAVENFLGIHY